MIFRCEIGPTSSRAKRRAATLVEAAFVLSVLVLMLFSIFEYGRLLMVRGNMINAAREGCRFAIVNDQDSNLTNEVISVVDNHMSVQDQQLTGLSITVFPTNNPSGAMSTVLPGDPITVEITGTYKTILPTIVMLPSSISLKTSAIMTCEGNQ